MNKTQLARWNSAKKLVEKLIRLSKLTSSDIQYDGIIISKNDITISSETGIIITVGNCKYHVFDTDPDMDNGLYTRKADMVKLLKSQFKLIKYIKW